MVNCKDCKHAIFCSGFGEYKCAAWGHRLHSDSPTDFTIAMVCTRYSTKKMIDVDKQCHCKVCEEINCLREGEE